MSSMTGSAVVSPGFTLIAASSTSPRGLATVILISAFMVSIVIGWLTPHVVIPVLINVASTMVLFLTYGSAVQIIAVREKFV